MKKITFRRCTVMAAVFAACLFAAGCKPNQPNPEPAPNPAPNPTPNPAPAPSLEVPMPNEPSVTPGGTIQQETIPNPDPSVETVNVKVKLESIGIPATPGQSHGISETYKAAQTYIIPVPKAIVDVDLKRAEKMQELLLLMLKKKGLGDCKLYKAATGAAGGAPDISNFSRDGGGTVFVGEPRKEMIVDVVNIDNGGGTITPTSVTFELITATTQYPSGSTNPFYVVPKIKEYPFLRIGTNAAKVQVEVYNTDTETEILAKVEGSVKRFLDRKIGEGKYVVFKEAAATNPVSYTKADLWATAGSKKLFIGIKEEPINKTLTVKPITASITIGSDNYTASALGTYPSTVNLGGVTTATSAADINTQLTDQFEASLGTGAFADYKLFCKGAPVAADELSGYNLEGDIIYIGKK